MLLVTGFVLTSCSSDDSNGSSPEESTVDYWPTAVGNEWVLAQSGSETTMKILSKEKINGETYFKFDKFITASSNVAGSASASIRKVQGDYYIKLDDIVTYPNGISSKISGYEFIGLRYSLKLCTLVHFALASKNTFNHKLHRLALINL